MANNNSGRDKNEKDLVCSFCGKHQDAVSYTHLTLPTILRV